jgi:hypothetical protein
MAMLFAMCCLTFVVLRRRLLHTIDEGIDWQCFNRHEVADAWDEGERAVVVCDGSAHGRMH